MQVVLIPGDGIGPEVTQAAQEVVAWARERGVIVASDECYAELDFDVVVGKNGDCWDRYLCRVEEMPTSSI